MATGSAPECNAHLVAEMGVRRLFELFRLGFSLHQAVGKRCPINGRVSRSQSRLRGLHPSPGCEPTARQRSCRIRPPDAFLITQDHVHPLNARTVRFGDTLVNEAHCRLRVGDGLLVVSDGISQAGIGSVFSIGVAKPTGSPDSPTTA